MVEEGVHVDAEGLVVEVDGGPAGWFAPEVGAAGVSSDGTHVWVANFRDNAVSEIDAATGAVVATIGVGKHRPPYPRQSRS